MECGSIPQQRYQLSGQKSIHQISITLTDKHRSSKELETNHSNSDSAQESSESFLVVGVGLQPPVCSYEITQDTRGLSVGTIAASMAKSIVGAVRSLAG